MAVSHINSNDSLNTGRIKVNQTIDNIKRSLVYYSLPYNTKIPDYDGVTGIFMINDILVRVGADISDFTRKMGQVVKESQGLSSQIKNVGDSMYNLGSKATKATAPITALGAAGQ